MSTWSRGTVSANHSSPVVPGIVHHDAAVVEADAEHEGVVQDPVDEALHLLLPAGDELAPRPPEVPPAGEASVEVLVVDVVSGVKSVAVRVGGREDVDLGGVEDAADPRIRVIVLSQVSEDTRRDNGHGMWENVDGFLLTFTIRHLFHFTLRKENSLIFI